MKLEFDFEKIKNSENSTIIKNELEKFLSYFFIMIDLKNLKNMLTIYLT